MKIDVKQQELIIRTAVSEHFRLLVFTDDYNGEHDCANSAWVRSKLHCIYMNQNVKMSIARFFTEQNITRLCINYVTFYRKRVVQMNCIGVYWLSKPIVSSWNIRIVDAIPTFIVCIINVIISYYLLKCPKKENQIATEPQRQSVYSVYAYHEPNTNTILTNQ